MADAVQKGIEAAQQDLVKDAEEKLLEEVNVIFDVILISRKAEGRGVILSRDCQFRSVFFFVANLIRKNVSVSVLEFSIL